MGNAMSKSHLRAQPESDLILACDGKKTKDEIFSFKLKKYNAVFTGAVKRKMKIGESVSI